MAEQYCPSCREKSFTWFIDEEVSSNTIWYCSICSYRAEENELLECICESCGTKNKIYLKCSDQYFYYCTHCRKKSEFWR